MAYLLDANVFIQAKNLHYGLDFCPAFWEWLIASNAAGKVLSIEKVGDEIAAGGDELSTWCAARGDGFFVKPDAAILQVLGRVSTWANGQNYEPAAINTFLQVADYYLVAYPTGVAILEQTCCAMTRIASRSGPGRNVPSLLCSRASLELTTIPIGVGQPRSE